MIIRTYTNVTADLVNDILLEIRLDGGVAERVPETGGTETIIARYANRDPEPITASDFPWMPIARGELGIHEGVNSERITEYFEDATDLGPQPDSVPWCSAFVNFCVQKSGQRGTRSARARSWENWGEDAGDFVPGCIVVLPRGGDPSQGHVGFFAGFEDQGNVRLLGGNQHDSVSVQSFPTARDNFVSRRILRHLVAAPAPAAGPALGGADVRALLIAAMDRHGIRDNQLRAGIAAICGGESGMKPHSEIGWGRTVTRPEGLARARRFFGALDGMSDDQIKDLAANDEAFFNTVYAGKIGNGDIASGDGFRYRGRGIIQLTGRDNYQRFGNKLQPPVDLVNDPERENDAAAAVETAVVYMLDRFHGGNFAAMKAAVGNSIGPPNANKDQLFSEFVASGEFNVA